MQIDLDEQPALRSPPVQLIELEDGAIVRRGAIEVKVDGEKAPMILQAIFSATAEVAVARRDLLDLFPEWAVEEVGELIDYLMEKRFLLPEGELGQEPNAGEGPLEVFYWTFGSRPDQVADNLNQRTFTLIGVNELSRRMATTFAAIGVSNIEVVDDPAARNVPCSRPTAPSIPAPGRPSCRARCRPSNGAKRWNRRLSVV